MTDLRKILIVDDDDMVRESVAMVLDRNQCQTTTASSAKEALEICKTSSFDLIFTDLVMPEMDGVELIKELRTRNNNTPIVTLTGGVRVGSKNLSFAALEAGAFLALKKPVNKQQLLDAIEMGTR
ncbi:response regulator [Terasakiella sp. SH-1]|uniref:response regulator n=1 Tax=Terasakiella sp. SH-1 TaxID=2560057 RepID=UPI001073B40F|nr:response regulator [Terasakiella sp. SH-1]